MTTKSTDLLPKIDSTVDGAAFLLGAGASYEAGYPLIAGLTTDVVNALGSADRQLMDDALAANKVAYDPKTNTPNIEEIADFVIAHAVNSGSAKFSDLEKVIRGLIVDRILAVGAPNIQHHVNLLNGLRVRSYGRSSTVWILTTNYDLLIELAAAECGIPLENGFVGAVERYFDATRLDASDGYGRIGSKSFAPYSGLTIKLIKLHGSISWIKRGDRFFEVSPRDVGSATERVMILPRRRKVMETLVAPHNLMFGAASRVIGTRCKYIASAGFSYGDQHINDDLLLPAVKAGSCRLQIVCKDEPPTFAQFKSFQAVHAVFENTKFSHGVSTAAASDAWKFSEFAKLF